MKKNKVVKVIKLTDNQKHFCDFIIIISMLLGFISLTGNILALSGYIANNYPFWLVICDIVLISFCELYLIIWKMIRLFKRSRKVL